MSPPFIPAADNSPTQHDGTDHLATNNIFLRRFLTLLVMRVAPVFSRWSGPCLPICKNLIVKTGPFVHLTEAAAMEFVASNTSIPVPRVHCSFVHKNRAYIVMDRIRGRSIPEVWGDLSDPNREAVLAQLRDMIRELRALPPLPGTGVESSAGGSLTDPRNPRSNPRFGPFENIQAFHLWLRDGFRPEEHVNSQSEQDWEAVKEMAAKQDGKWPPLVFTHGDLNLFNILVAGNRIVGLIDWESAGWYPSYWEYTSAWTGNVTQKGWQDLIPKFLDPYPDELRMELTRQKWWGEF